MSTHSVDLAAYFERIGYSGSRSPNLETLNALIAGHIQRIPFENLDILLKQPISIELHAIEEKLVARQRGGYCFEHNALFAEVLQTLGFQVSLLSARSRYQLLPGQYRPRTHVLLRVELADSSYLVDVGFGGLSPTAALQLTPGVTQITPHEPRRLVLEGDWQSVALRGPAALLVHQAHFADRWHDLYELTLEVMPPADREMGNWYTSAHPRSHFRNGLMAARATASGRLTLLDRELTTRDREGESSVRRLDSHAELLEVLKEDFGLVFPAGTRFDCAAWAEAP